LRQAAGKSTNEAGNLLRRTASQVSKIENGWYLPAFAELMTLLIFYDANAEQSRQAEILYTDAKQDSRRIQGSSGVPPKFRAFLRAEADASRIYELQSVVVPGLLQTDEYHQSIRAAGRRIIDPKIDKERALAARRARRELLTGKNPLKFHALIDEGVIRRIVGGPKCMSRQLKHLTTIAQQHNVTLQIIREDAGAYGTMSGPLTILEFADPQDPDTVYLEYQGGGEWVDDDANIKSFKSMFEDIADQASSPSDSIDIISERISRLSS
jgi:hypothetical protein